MFFLLYGEDVYRSRRKLGMVRVQFAAKRDATGLNSATYREGDHDITEVLEGLFASPFLAEKKLVVLEGFLRAPAGVQERLQEALTRQPDSTVSVWYEDCAAVDLEKTTLFPLLSKQPFSECFTALSGRELSKFVADECADGGCVIEPKAIEALIASVSADSYQLHLEAQKMCAYTLGLGGKTIRADAIAKLAPAKHDDTIFNLIDACAEQKSGQALLLVERLVAAGVSEMQIMSLLLKQFKTLIAVGDLMDRGERDKFVIAKTLGIHHFPAGKAMIMSRKWQHEQARAAYREVLEIDRKLKTGYAKPKVLLQLFAARVRT